MIPTPDLAAALGPALLPMLGGHSAVYLTGEDRLRLRTFNSFAGVELALEGRFLSLEGRVEPFAERHVPNTDRTLATTTHPRGEGWLLGAQIRASSGAPRRGQCFAMLDVVRGQTGAIQPLQLLTKGYVTDTTPRAWPSDEPEDSCEGPGVIRSITGTDPAAGAEVSETVPTNARWRLMAVFVQFVADANVANRNPFLIIDDGATTLLEIGSSTSITAGQTINLNYGAVGGNAAPGSNGHVISIPPDLYLMGGFRIRTATTSIQAGDNFGAPQLWVEEWIED
jgi:hypothetical protein